MILTKEQVEYYYKNVLGCEHKLVRTDEVYYYSEGKYLYVYRNKYGSYVILQDYNEPDEENGMRTYITHIKEIARYFKIKEILE